MLQPKGTLDTVKALDASIKKNTGYCEGTGCFNQKEHWIL
jgi:hypothetical protein